MPPTDPDNDGINNHGQGLAHGPVDATTWHREADVVVVGFGGAGAAAAIEAARAGADTLVIERFSGGGATRMSGGIYYSGGGTELQLDANYPDTPEEMFNYLRCETEGEAVDDEVLRAFCDDSVENFEWLKALGVPFPKQGFAPIKTSYPSNETTLYYSGNEKSPPYSDRATPAPRGHRPIGKGLTGKVLYEPMRAAAIESGAEVLYRSRATRLISDDDGRVIGVEIHSLPDTPAAKRIHSLLREAATGLGAVSRLGLMAAKAVLERFEKAKGRTLRIRARGGVVLSAGGFIYNPDWVTKYLPTYAKTMRLGTIGDDGSGIALGTSVGGAVRKMERGTAWMFINPPAGLTEGILISRRGQRICNEELYGAALGERIAEFHEGGAILLLDAQSKNTALRDIVGQKKLTFQSTFALVNLFLNRKRARSLADLERKLNFPVGALQGVVDTYNRGVETGKDEFGKSAGCLRRVEKAPFYAVDCDTDNRKFATPSISLGGLDVDGLTAQVLRPDRTRIPGLFAAGRTAAGVCSQHYVSGLSVADGIFAGRRAGQSASRATHPID